MIKPLNRNLIVKQKEREDKTKSGLILTTNTTETPSCGIVVSKASDCDVEFYEGDIVYYSKYAGSKLIFDSIEYLVLNEEDLLGVEEI